MFHETELEMYTSHVLKLKWSDLSTYKQHLHPSFWWELEQLTKQHMDDSICETAAAPNTYSIYS